MEKTIYCIIEQSWDGWRYTPDGVLCFSSKEKRSEVLEKMSESNAYKKGNIDFDVYDAELDAEF